MSSSSLVFMIAKLLVELTRMRGRGEEVIKKDA